MAITHNVFGGGSAQNSDQTDVDIAHIRDVNCMVLDDDFIDAEYLVYQLQHINGYRFDVAVAKSVEEAHQQLETRDIDLFLIDFWLAHETSIAFIDEIAHERHR
jgi:response regulator of citrate/malate metabolism